ncbi:MAG: BNR-4 repeat-containing protein [Bacteroidales bacterium]
MIIKNKNFDKYFLNKIAFYLFIFSFAFISHVRALNFPDDPEHYTKVFSEDGAWCWFSDPRAVYYEGNHKRTYAGFVTSGGDITVAFYDHLTEEISEVVIYPELQKDDHVNPSLLILPDGRIMAFFTRHNGGFYYTRTISPEDISKWEEVSYIDMGPGLCYTNPALLSSENNRIYVYLRGGYDWKPTFIYSDDLGKTWSDPETFVAHAGATDNDRPYAKIVSDGKSKVWFAITDGHPRNEPLNSIYVFYYENGHFHQVDGTRIGNIGDIPIDQGIINKAYDGTETMVRSWIWDLAIDHNGYPRIVYTRLLEETRHQYYYAFWDGSSWEHSFISLAGQDFPREERTKEQRNREPHYSGGVVLDPQKAGVVYYSRPVNDRYEIFKGVLRDNKWAETPVTTNSELDNVRPFVVKNSPLNSSPRLFWMTNRMYQHYSVYDTFLMMKLQQ